MDLKKTLFFTITVFFFLHSLSLFTAKTSDLKKIDKQLDKCLKKDPTTYGVIKCVGIARKKWDIVLNKSYRELLKILKPGAKKALIKSQKLWVKFYIKEKKFLGAMYYRSKGSMYRISANFALLNLKKTRALQLSGYTAMNKE